MSNIRNWYIYLTTAISLNSVVWALISMLRNQVTAGAIRADRSYLALQIAILIIGLPIFLIHWTWAQRLSSDSKEEQHSPIRQIYLYFILAVTLTPMLANLFTFFAHELDTFGKSFMHLLVTLIPLAATFYYHHTIIDNNKAGASIERLSGSIRRLYIYGFSAAGLWMLIQAAINLLHRLFLELSRSTSMITRFFSDGLTPEITRAFIGLTLWVVFWNWAQGAFVNTVADEQRSTIRKAYLYIITFISSLSAVWAASAIFAGYLRQIFNVTSNGLNEGPELGYAVIISMGAIWAYHASIIRQDAAMESDQDSQSSVRRIYLYLVAAIGLGALLVGLLGITNTLIETITSTATFGDGLKRQVAWSVAAIIAGLPVWLLPWQKAQLETGENAVAASVERRSTTRKIYLYIYLFQAVMAALGGLIYIVFQILLLALGERTIVGMFSDLAHALSFTLIGFAVLGYHGSILRGDTRQEESYADELMQDFNLVLLGKGDGEFARSLQLAISAELPHITLTSIGLSKPAADVLDVKINPKADQQAVASADLIVGAWDISLGESGDSSVTSAIIASPAVKLLAPTPKVGWAWAGVEDWSNQELVQQTIQAIKQFREGAQVKMARKLGLGAIAVMVVGGLCLLSVVFVLIGELLF